MTTGNPRYLGNEFLDFAENLKINQFRSISPGIGIGQIRGVPRTGASDMVSHNPQDLRGESMTEGRFDLETVQATNPRYEPAGISSKLWWASLGTTLVDIVLFLTTLCVVLTGMVGFFTFYRPDLLAAVTVSPAWLWLVQGIAWKLPLVVGLGYAVFWGLFQFILGRSLGAVLLGQEGASAGDGF